MNKKIISFSIGIFSFLFVLFVPTPHANAQNTNQTLLVVTQFERGQKLDFFFNNSLVPVEFFEVKDTPPVFVSFISEEQLNRYKDNGYDPIVIDKNAGAINQYYLLYGKRYKNAHQAAILQDEVQKNQGLELAYQLTNYVSIVKVAQGKKLEQLSLQDLKHAHARQLSGAVQPQNTLVARTKPTRAPEKDRPILSQANNAPQFPTIFSFFVVFAVILLFVYQAKKPRDPLQ